MCFFLFFEVLLILRQNPGALKYNGNNQIEFFRNLFNFLLQNINEIQAIINTTAPLVVTKLKAFIPNIAQM